MFKVIFKAGVGVKVGLRVHVGCDCVGLVRLPPGGKAAWLAPCGKAAWPAPRGCVPRLAQRWQWKQVVEGSVRVVAE